MSLDRRSFTSVSITKNGTAMTLVPTGDGKPGTVLLEFRPGHKMSANAGCNGVSGDYELDGAKLRVPEPMSTLMGCDPAMEAQDQWLRSFIADGPTLAIDGDTLTLSDNSTVIEFEDREVADPDRPLVGPTWTVDTVYSGGTVGSTAGSKPTVVFAEGGRLTYHDSCAGGRAKWKRNDNQITFSEQQPNPTAVPCPPSDSREEEALVKTLNGGTWTMEIDGPRLDLKRGDEGIGLRTDA